MTDLDRPDPPRSELPDVRSISHEHPDVTGGWLRPAVFGAMDGLVSNFALVMGVTGGSDDTKPVLLAGLAGLAAGAFSMAAGEYTSVASQSEFALAQIEIERREIERNGPAEQAELAAMYVDKGVEEDTARDAAAQIHRDVDNAVEVHAREEFGVDADDLASPSARGLARRSSPSPSARWCRSCRCWSASRRCGRSWCSRWSACSPAARSSPTSPAGRGGSAASASSCSAARQPA